MKTLQLSATQIENASGCLRRWWLKSVQKLPVLDTKSKRPLIFGIVFHDVCKRFNLQDDRGQGQELFPFEWYKAKEKDEVIGELNVPDQHLIKHLISTGIEQGVLIREPGRQAEHFFEMILPVTPKVKSRIIGYIDLLLPAAVWDYKTPKNTRWAMSPQKLRSNIQMNVYAAHALSRDESPDQILIGHKAFIKNPENPVVQERSTMVSRDSVSTFWDMKIHPVMKNMARVFEAYPKGNEDQWQNVTPAADDNECNHYYGGPCPFAQICIGQCTPDAYRQHVKTIESRPPEPEYIVEENPKRTDQKGEKPMSSLLKKLRDREKAHLEAKVEEPKTDGEEYTMPVQEAVEEAVPESEKDTLDVLPEEVQTENVGSEETKDEVMYNECAAPAWADRDCHPCKGTGFNKDGTPCMICQIKTGVSAPKDAAKVAEPKVSVRPTVEIVEPEPEKDETPVEIVDAPEEVMTTQEQSLMDVLHRRDTFTLYIGCVPVDSPIDQAERVLAIILRRIHEATHKDPLTIDHFALRDMIAAEVRELDASGKEICFLDVPTKGSRLDALLTALKEKADRVVARTM